MAQRKLTLRSKTTSLLNRLQENPQLPAYVQNLPPADLISLVNHIGKEDAQALLVHATASQMSELIETDAWKNPRPGTEERFSPETFLEWIELWSDSGAALLTRRLKESGSGLFALTLQQYVVVVDIYEVGVEGPTDTFGRFAVIAENEEMWSLLFDYVTQVWDEDPEFMEEVLGQCCLRRSLTIEKTYITHNENLALDVEASRDRHRRDRGYVTPLSSAAFLRRIRSSTLEELLLDGSYDGYSAVQIRNMKQGRHQGEQATESSAADIVSNSGDASVTTTQALEELATLIEPLLNKPALDILLLGGPDLPHKSYLQEQLGHLAERQPEHADDRTRELIYLSNILMEGTSASGAVSGAVNSARLNQSDALDAAASTVNLGLTYCIFTEPWLSEEELLTEFMENEPGLIKAFNVGYYLLMELAGNVESALSSALQHDDIRRRLQLDQILAQEIQNAFSRYQTQRQAKHAFSNSLQQTVDDLSVLFNPSVCAEISIMGGDFPRFPRSLDPLFQPGLRVDRSAHFISEVEELDLLTLSLKTLASRLNRRGQGHLVKTRCP